jgi:hypothetical protein
MDAGMPPQVYGFSGQPDLAHQIVDQSLSGDRRQRDDAAVVIRVGVDVERVPAGSQTLDQGNVPAL